MALLFDYCINLQYWWTKNYRSQQQIHRFNITYKVVLSHLTLVLNGPWLNNFKYQFMYFSYSWPFLPFWVFLVALFSDIYQLFFYVFIYYFLKIISQFRWNKSSTLGTIGNNSNDVRLMFLELFRSNFTWTLIIKNFLLILSQTTISGLLCCNNAMFLF